MNTTKKVPAKIKRVDPDAEFYLKWGGGYAARVHGEEFDLGRTMENVKLTLSETDILSRMRAVQVNRELDLPVSALTGKWVVQGHDDNGYPFSREDGERAAGKIRHRHLCTNYDQLLQDGFSKKEAREDMEG